METVARFTERETTSGPVPLSSAPEPVRTLAATATYTLSEEGRKASLLAGGDGRAVQQITLQVPANRLHLVSVDRQGVARLKLRPRFEVDGDQRVVRVDSVPLYDAPPTVDDLYRAAAKNHELESAYYADRTAAKARRAETDREFRERVAEAFLSDPAQRAVVHPPPSAKHCLVVTERGRILFDVATDTGLAKDLPPEAHRRFRADLRAKEERNRTERAAQLAVHEEKKRFVADWIAAHASEEQKARQAAGVLPMDEAVEAITDVVFAPLGDRPRYVRDGVDRLRAHLAQFPEHAGAAVTQADVVVLSDNAQTATAEQWAVVRECQACLPDATVVLRRHRISFKRDARVPPVVLFGVLVTMRFGPFVLRREFAVA